MNERTLRLLAPRPNPEIPALLQIIRRSMKELQAEDDHTCRRGRAAILIAHLKSLMDEPETISEAALPGVLDDDAFRFVEDEMPEVNSFLAERPFDMAGHSADLFFFYTDTGKFSPLYRAPAIDPGRVHILWSFGYFVHTMEKVYATESPTTMHARYADVCGKLLRAEGFPLSGTNERSIAVFIDPKGCCSPEPSSGFAVARFEDQTTAEEAADFLAACLNVRFLVARKRYTLCTH